MDANATITKTMIVVMVTSRRVGQVTLAASERTSCRNLNGLKAILSIQGRRETMFDCKGIPSSRCEPSPRWKDEPQNELDCSGGIQRRAGYPKNGPAAGGGYLRGGRANVKIRADAANAVSTIAAIRFSAKCLKRWQEWQGSNLRPPVLETGALPIELHSCREPGVTTGSRRFKHRPCPVCKCEAPGPASSCNSFCATLSFKQQEQRERP